MSTDKIFGMISVINGERIYKLHDKIFAGNSLPISNTSKWRAKYIFCARYLWIVCDSRKYAPLTRQWLWKIFCLCSVHKTIFPISKIYDKTLPVVFLWPATIRMWTSTTSNCLIAFSLSSIASKSTFCSICSLCPGTFLKKFYSHLRKNDLYRPKSAYVWRIVLKPDGYTICGKSRGFILLLNLILLLKGRNSNILGSNNSKHCTYRNWTSLCDWLLFMNNARKIHSH